MTHTFRWHEEAIKRRIHWPGLRRAPAPRADLRFRRRRLAGDRAPGRAPALTARLHEFAQRRIHRRQRALPEPGDAQPQAGDDRRFEDTVRLEVGRPVAPVLAALEEGRRRAAAGRSASTRGCRRPRTRRTCRPGRGRRSRARRSRPPGRPGHRHSVALSRSAWCGGDEEQVRLPAARSGRQLHRHRGEEDLAELRERGITAWRRSLGTSSRR